MPKCQFSETQFVFGYLNELFSNNNFAGIFLPYFMFPTQSMERVLPVDFFADFYDHSEFYQFKRSYYLKRRRGKHEKDAGIQSDFLPYYRLKIYNRTTPNGLGQFDKLKELALRFQSDLVCYCAPCFYSEANFHTYFNTRVIMQNSILIECNQFNNIQFNPPNFNINDGSVHYLLYKPTSSIGYLCSEKKEIKVMLAKNKNELIKKSDNGKGDFLITLKALYSDFYLKDKSNLSEDIAKNDNAYEQIIKVKTHLLQHYNILWQPIFRDL